MIEQPNPNPTSPETPAPASHENGNAGTPDSAAAHPGDYQPIGNTPPPPAPLPAIALILSILGLFTGVLISGASIIVGIVGKRKAQQLHTPTTTATTAIIIGTAGTIIHVALILFFLLAVSLGN